jgi:hypothetical protein
MTFFALKKPPSPRNKFWDRLYPNQDGVEVSKIKKPSRPKGREGFENIKSDFKLLA